MQVDVAAHALTQTTINCTLKYLARGVTIDGLWRESGWLYLYLDVYEPEYPPQKEKFICSIVFHSAHLVMYKMQALWWRARYPACLQDRLAIIQYSDPDMLEHVLAHIDMIDGEIQCNVLTS